MSDKLAVSPDHPAAPSRQKKLPHIEFMRILAIYFVMFTHTELNGFFLFSVTPNPVKQYAYLFLSIGCKFAVPLFFMISGALLLGKEESLQTLYRKRILRFLGALLLASLFFWLYHPGSWAEKRNPIAFLNAVYSRILENTLWYLYSYLSMLVMLPLLRKMAKAMEGRDYLYLAGMQLIFVGILPICEYVFNRSAYTLNPYFQPVLFTAKNITYVFMGYYAEHVLPSRCLTKKTILRGAALSVLSILLCSFLTLHRGRLTGCLAENDSEWFFDCLIAIPTYTVYLASKWYFSHAALRPGLQAFLTAAGSTTFGICLFEAVFRDKTSFVFFALRPYLKTMPACLIWIFCALILGSSVVWVLKKLPVLKHLL